jgi:predicted  nucleic acid-binding Zn-ribbon protein
MSLEERRQTKLTKLIEIKKSEIENINQTITKLGNDLDTHRAKSNQTLKAMREVGTMGGDVWESIKEKGDRIKADISIAEHKLRRYQSELKELQAGNLPISSSVSTFFGWNGGRKSRRTRRCRKPNKSIRKR